jgi:hypothetical protein
LMLFRNVGDVVEPFKARYYGKLTEESSFTILNEIP